MSASRRALCLLLGFALSLGLSPAAGAAGPDRTKHDRVTFGEHAQDHVVVRLAPGIGAQRFGPEARPGRHGWAMVPVPAGKTPEQFVEELAANPMVEVAEVDRYRQIFPSAPFTPNDPLWVGGANNPFEQWHMHRIDLPTAWQQSVGTGVKVAVIDTGVTNGALDGFCRPLVDEYDPVFGVSGPGTGADFDGHGSHVAGTIAQCGGNGKWGIGVAPDAQIMPINAFVPEGTLDFLVADGIYWAIDHGAKVINMSLGGGAPSATLNAAIAAAVAADIVLVAAAGNDPGPVAYPASHSDVIAVGAVDWDNDVASYSGRGTGLDLVAPGGDDWPVWQEAPPVSTTQFVGSTGTSMAAPHVSGVAALLRSRYPGASSLQVREAMRCSALDLGAGGWDDLYGWGLVQAGQAMTQLGQIVSSGQYPCVDLPAGATKIATVGNQTGFWELWHGLNRFGGFYYGNPGDIPFMGDWNCDGVDTPGLYRQSDGFVYLRNSNTQGIADISFFFGNPGDVPMIGDFDGDGCDTVSIYRPFEARFYIIDKLGTNGGGLGAAAYSYLFGNLGDVPFMSDWNGDGIDTPGLRRPSDGFVYLRNSNTQGVADIGFFYGNPGDIVFAGDWDDDTRDSIGLYRPSNGTIYLRNALSTGIADVAFSVGQNRRPAAGDF